MHLTKQSVFSGLGTESHGVVSPGIYQIVARTTDLPPSGITLTLSQSGSKSVSTSKSADNVNAHLECIFSFNCLVGDVLSVTLSSSAPADQPPNMIKTTIDLKQGSY